MYLFLLSLFPAQRTIASVRRPLNSVACSFFKISQIRQPPRCSFLRLLVRAVMTKSTNKRHRFSDSEKEAIVRGVRVYGVGTFLASY